MFRNIFGIFLYSPFCPSVLSTWRNRRGFRTKGREDRSCLRSNAQPWLRSRGRWVCPRPRASKRRTGRRSPSWADGSSAERSSLRARGLWGTPQWWRKSESPSPKWVRRGRSPQSRWWVRTRSKSAFSLPPKYPSPRRLPPKCPNTFPILTSLSKAEVFPTRLLCFPILILHRTKVFRELSSFPIRYHPA